VCASVYYCRGFELEGFSRLRGHPEGPESCQPVWREMSSWGRSAIYDKLGDQELIRYVILEIIYDYRLIFHFTAYY
jgi:hypothetical protein